MVTYPHLRNDNFCRHCIYLGKPFAHTLHIFHNNRNLLRLGNPFAHTIDNCPNRQNLLLPLLLPFFRGTVDTANP